MKKNLFVFISVVVMLVCVFAISASAVTPNNDGEAYTTSNGTTLALYDTDGKALAWFYDSTTSEYVAYRVEIDFTFALNGGRELLPTSTILDTDGDDSTTFPYTVSNMILLNGRDYEAFTYISGTWSSMPLEAIYVNNTFRWINKGSFNSDANLRVFDIPKDTLSTLHFGGSAFWGASNLQSIFIPKSSYFEGSSTFEGSGIQTVEFAGDYEGTKIPNHTFYNCYKLSGHLVLPSSITEIQQYAFAFKSNVADNTVSFTITLPAKLTTVGEKFFQNNNSLIAINFTGTSLKAIDSPAFENCKRLTSVVLPEGLTTLGNCIFLNCSSLTSVTLPTTLTTVNGNNNFAYTGLTEVIGLENTKLTSISYAMFRGLKSWTPDVIKLPNTVTTIATYGFADVGVKKVVLGASLVTISNEAFTGCKSMTEFVLPGGLTSIYFNNSTARLFFVTSTDTTYLETIKSTSGAKEIVPYATYIANTSNYASGKYVISGYNLCDAFYDGVDYVEGVTDCTQDGICTRCGRVFEGQETHAIVETLVFPEGLVASGIYTCDCTNEGCTVIDVLVGDEQGRDVVKPLFTAKGYSLSPDKNAINGGYTINRDTLTLYNDVKKTNLVYGIVIANAEKFDGKSFFNESNKVNTNKALQVEIDNEYSNFDCSINFGTTANNSIKLIICAYVIEGDNVTFIQAESGEPVDSSLVTGGSFKSVTLDYVAALPTSKEEEIA
ncbi:MAG: leucine-rich repeat protein [Clostridia bacterium]|nr:leucine-rich repeat protein [Clostridia bacterium]